jgi:hypothetical protein
MRRTSKKLTWILSILVLTIWGTIAFNIVDSMSGEENASVAFTVHAGKPLSDSLQTYTFTSEIRDPFHYVMPHHLDSSKKSLVKKPIWNPPPFKLTGIVTTGKKHTAMIEGLNGAVYFLQEQDTLSGMKILRIRDQAVTYSYQKKKTDWILDRP